jgi:competence protein ComEA
VKEQGTAKSLSLVVLCSVLSLMAGGLIVYFSLRGHAPTPTIVVSTPLPTSTSLPSPTPAPIRVYVSGAVQTPAVCALPPGSIVREAIDAAGGPTSDADLACINLALELKDQQHVHVPRKGEENPSPGVSGGVPHDEAAPININTASASQLETLPGVGEVTAQRIIEYRQANGPFETIEEIQNVSGIGLTTFEGMRDLIVVGP